MSAPDVVLAAIAARTSRIRLGPAVTVLGSDDPARVFQRFSTLDAVSNGRAEVILGRGYELGLSRFDLKYSAGTLPHDQMMAGIELHRRKVAPLVRDQLRRRLPVHRRPRRPR